MSTISKAAKRNLALLLLVTSVAAYFAVRFFTASSDWFVEHSIPLKETQRLFDIGVVDANGDNFLDIYTSNHHFRQTLLIADGKGGYRDVLSEWGLDQDHAFPRAELSYTAPQIDKAGAYVYWYGTNIVIRAHKTSEIGRWSGSLHTFDPVKIIKNDGFHIEKHENKTAVTETKMEFSPTADGMLVMQPGGQGLPLEFSLDGAIKPAQVFVGSGKVSPPETNFSLTMKDRHAMAWADYNDDGILDIFIDRGALSGTLRAYPEHVQRGIKDELLVSQGEGRYVDIVSDVGIEKKGCSGRHARWLDFNHDGLLDLFVNCYNREHVAGSYPKQLYRQDEHKQFHDVAAETGIGLPDRQIGSFAWIDVDNDGDVDLVAFQDDGIYLYRNQEGRFYQEILLKRPLAGADRIGDDKDNRWLFDGKLSVSDYDADGDLDIFSASRRGNLLLKNEGGRFLVIDPATVGLPAKSATACWVDYDNDGLTDLYLFPQGLFRQRKDHTFEATKLLSFPNNEQFLAAICNWFDLDNDGKQDLLLALHENPYYKHWWEFSRQRGRPEQWRVLAYRNVDARNHWLQIALKGNPGNRQGIGAQVTVVTPDSRQVQEVGSTDGAFFSQGHYRLYFGLGKHASVNNIRIRWSDGQTQELKDVQADRLIKITREDKS